MIILLLLIITSIMRAYCTAITCSWASANTVAPKCATEALLSASSHRSTQNISRKRAYSQKAIKLQQRNDNYRNNDLQTLHDSSISRIPVLVKLNHQLHLICNLTTFREGEGYSIRVWAPLHDYVDAI